MREPPIYETDPELHAQAEQEKAKYRKSKPPPNGADHEEQALEFTIASSLANRPVPERPWLVDDWIPRRQVTLLTGDGGIGKSLLALQLMIACSARQRWLGLSTMPCRTCGIFAEDDENELLIRLAAITKGENIDIASLDGLAWRSAIIDPCELVEVNDRGRTVPTKYFSALENYVDHFMPGLLTLDAATNLFGGDEIKRRQVNAFLMLLRRIAIKIDGSVLLLAHPSVQGIASDTGLSGSTHWNNSVRSRLWFRHATGENVDPQERLLKRLKANYATKDELRVRYDSGRFVALGEPTGVDRAAETSKADRIFKQLLTMTYANGVWTSPSPTSNNYAPTIFAKRPDREGLGKHMFEESMYRMMTAGTVKSEQYGRPSDPRFRLALA